MSASIAALAVCRILDVATRVDRQLVLRVAGIAQSALNQADARIAASRVYTMWQRLIEWSGDSALPAAVARSVALDELGPLGFTVLTAPSVGSALEYAVAAYPAAITDDGRWSISRHGGMARLDWHRPGPPSPGRQASTESGVAQFAACVRQTAHAPIAIGRIRFRHQPGDGLRIALGELLDCPVEGGAERDGFDLRGDQLAAIPRMAHPGMHSFFRAHTGSCTNLHRGAPGAASPWRSQPSDDSAMATRSTTDRAGAIIRHRLADGQLDMADIARTLGMTRRTLHRKLAGENISFRRLVAAIRRDQAEVLLERTDRSIAEIALELGFSDASAFSRAYRRWSGQAPSDCRRHRAVPRP